MAFSSVAERLAAYRRALEAEKQAQIAFHQSEIQSLPARERERRGRCILDCRPGTRPRWTPLGTIEMTFWRRTPLPDTQIQPGDIVLIQRMCEKPRVIRGRLATVVALGRQSLIVQFQDMPSVVELRQWRQGTRIDLYLNETPFERMNWALEQWMQNPPNAFLAILHGEAVPDPDARSLRSAVNPTTLSEHCKEALGEIHWYQSHLNDWQRLAVCEALRRRLALIHGPPGTGKTTTLTEIVLQCVRRGERLLVCADSNVAVDNFIEKILQVRKDLVLVRIGHPVRVHSVVQHVTLEAHIQRHPLYPELESWIQKKEALLAERDRYPQPTPAMRRGLSNEEILRFARMGKGARGLSSKQIQGLARWVQLQEEIIQCVQKIDQLRMEAIQDILNKAQVVCATNIGAGIEYLRAMRFDRIVLDEATQATPPAQLIPLLFGDRWVMAGDPRQLPPVVLSRSAEPVLSRTLFEELQTRYASSSVLLRVQYRMHQRIMEPANRLFYQGQLIADARVAHRTLRALDGFREPENLPRWLQIVVSADHPLVWVWVQGQEARRPGSYSWYNIQEAKAVQTILQALLMCNIKPEWIGVITPYEDQRLLLKRLLADDAYRTVEIHTVDGFQGREKEVIVLSLVRANPRGEVGFLMDARRLNVAITRAKTKLVIAGDLNTLTKHPLYQKLISEVRHTGVFVTYPQRAGTPVPSTSSSAKK